MPENARSATPDGVLVDREMRPCRRCGWHGTTPITLDEAEPPRAAFTVADFARAVGSIPDGPQPEQGAGDWVAWGDYLRRPLPLPDVDMLAARGYIGQRQAALAKQQHRELVAAAAEREDRTAPEVDPW